MFIQLPSVRVLLVFSHACFFFFYHHHSRSVLYYLTHRPLPLVICRASPIPVLQCSCQINAHITYNVLHYHSSSVTPQTNMFKPSLLDLNSFVFPVFRSQYTIFCSLNMLYTFPFLCLCSSSYTSLIIGNTS